MDNEFSHSRLALDLSDQNTDYYFIEYKGKQIGFIKIKFSLPPSFIENSVELEKIYVLPDFKSMGIGKMALNSIIRDSEHRGKDSVFFICY